MGRIDRNRLWPVPTPSGRLRFAPPSKLLRNLSNSGPHRNLNLQYTKTRKEAGFCVLVGPGGFEPPTSTMSR
jgi:hypothetical protein